MIIKVRAFPNSRENKIIEIGDGIFEIKVKERAENNDANFAVLKMLSERFKVSGSRIKFISGIKSRNKVLKIE